MQNQFDMAEAFLACAGTDGQDAEHQLIKLMDRMPGGFFAYNAGGGQEILYVNAAMLRIFGCDDFAEFRDLTGGTFPGMVHPDDFDEVERSIHEQIAQSQFDLDYVEYRIIRKDGAVRWLEDHGHFIRSGRLGEIFYVFVADATEKIEQRQAEHDALQRENAYKSRRLAEYHRESSRRRELIEGLSVDYESIFYAELDEDRIHAYRLSRQAGELFLSDPPSRDYSGFVQEYIQRWVHPEDRGLIADTLDPARIRERLAGHPLLHVNYRLMRGGRTEYLQLRIVNVGKGGRVSQVVIGARSVDEEIRSALEQKEFLADALAQARSAVAAKNAFLSNMSHDMRTPLNAIKGFTELAKRSTDGQGRLARYLEMIEVSSSQLLRLISNVLEIARIESGGELVAQEPCSLREIVGRVRTALFTQIASKNLVMAVETEGLRHPVVYSDAHKLEEILFHLCSNAVKYTGPGGHVWVRVLEQEAAPGFGYYRLVVEDDGIGISQGFLGHIFEFFAREQNTTISGVHGTGLGLPIMKSLVEMMDGTIDVESEPGKGSRFTVTLPLRIKAEPQQEKPPMPHVQKPCAGTGKILVVDDNELNLEIAVELLREAGFEVEAVQDGSMAVERLRRAAPGEFVLVLMDIQMPVMDGCSAAREIRALDDPGLASIPIIALSANAFEEDKRKALESGMNLHLAKPLDIELLLEQIDRLAK